jgi:arylsulfatase A-like enzyme
MPAGLRPRLTKKKIQALEAEYRLRIESLQAVDELVKNVVSTLESLGKLEDTYIVFSSDNGYHLGEHRLPAGKDYHYEEDIRVPLLVRGPDIQAGLHIKHLAGNIDLAPTFAELAGARVPRFVDGRSLVPLLFNEPVDRWRHAYLLQKVVKDNTSSSEASDRDYSTYDPSTSLFEASDLSRYQVQYVYTGLRTDDYTYVEFGKHSVHLYDLNEDPYQLENIAFTADPALLEEMHNWLSKLRKCRGWSCRSIEVHP